MNFDDLMHYDLMTGIFRFIPFLLILIFWHGTYSLQCVKELRNSEWGKSEVKRESRALCKTKKQ